MSLKEEITIVMKTCMKEKLKTELAGLRMLNAAIKNKEIDTRKELTDDEVVAVIKKQIKEHEQSLSFLKDPEKQQEDILKYKTYISTLEGFLPEEMDINDARIFIMEELSKAGITSKSQMGQAMKLLKEKIAGQLDNSKISQIVREFLV